MTKVLYKDGSSVNLIQKSFKEVRPISTSRKVTTPVMLKQKSIGKSLTLVEFF